jgi:hypothetical protein
MTTLFVDRGAEGAPGAFKVQYIGVVTTAAIAFVSLALSAYAAYSHNDKDLSNRVVAVETQQKNDHERAADDRDAVKRIESKVDRLLYLQTGVKP